MPELAYCLGGFRVNHSLYPKNSWQSWMIRNHHDFLGGVRRTQLVTTLEVPAVGRAWKLWSWQETVGGLCFGGWVF